MPSRVPPLTALLVALAACAPPTAAERERRFDVAAPDAARAAEQLALEHLGRPTFRSGVQDFVALRTLVDDAGVAHTRVRQQVGGVPVFGGGAIVHVPADGRPLRITDGFVRDLSVDTRPEVPAGAALALARRAVSGPIDDARVDLQVLRRPEGDFLTWRVQVWSLSDGEPAMPVLFVDAHTGREVHRYDNLQTGLDRATHDANNGTALPGTLARGEGDTATGDDAVDDAHDYVKISWDYFDQLQGRDSFDDNGATVVSTVHYRTNYSNAFWTGSQLGYGDGGPGFNHFANDLDVVAHELTHGVTQWTAGLIYQNESGGLNEATSDIMAAVVEAWDDGWTLSDDVWDVGEDIAQTGAFRYMDDPTADGRSLDDYDDYYDGINVHFSSGIANHAFYEWVQDEDVTIEEAGDIWYRALQYYMQASTDFPEARAATVQAATDLFGVDSAEVDAVKAGWDDVNVPEGLRWFVKQTVAEITLAEGSTAVYTFTPSEEAEGVRFTLEGGTGDADLLVNLGSAPTSSDYDCFSYSPDGLEICQFDPSSTGTYHVEVDAWTALSNVTLKFWEGATCLDLDDDGATNCDGDCNDADPSISPSAPELCNHVDDDCDGEVDGPESVDAVMWYRDADADGYGDAAVSQAACAQPLGYVADGTDCADALPAVNPGADEVCDDDDVDEDCDGEAEEADALGTLLVLLDEDGDGYGDDAKLVETCQLEDGQSTVGGDCDDDDPQVHPDAVESCEDRRDLNCDGSSGADDLDRDGAQACDDCDDRNPDRFPGAEEVCDGQDNDCNSLVDDGATDASVWYEDNDGDGVGSSVEILACLWPDGAAPVSGDCDDNAADVYPGAPDAEDDGIDQDCDGQDDGDLSLTTGCTCTSSPGSAPVVPLALMLTVLGWRRRERSARA